MLTVITPAGSTALTTAARATAMLELGIGDAAALAIAIPQASQMVTDHCRRPFARETVREVLRHEGRAGVLLARSPVTAFVSVAEGDTVLTGADYEYDGATGLLHRLVGVHASCWYASPLTIEYTAGFTLPADTGSWTLPPAVERAAVLIIGAILAGRERDPMLRSEEIVGVRTVSYWVREGQALPSAEAETLLEPYRRIVG